MPRYCVMCSQPFLLSPCALSRLALRFWFLVLSAVSKFLAFFMPCPRKIVKHFPRITDCFCDYFCVVEKSCDIKELGLTFPSRHDIKGWVGGQKETR